MNKNVKKENFFKSFYNTLLSVGELLNKKDTSGKVIIVRDLLILIVVTCLLKIPFIFIRDILDGVLEVIFSSNVGLMAIWGLFIELTYIIVALIFFKRTLKRYVEKEEK